MPMSNRSTKKKQKSAKFKDISAKFKKYEKI